jgi:hypothetical protein
MAKLLWAFDISKKTDAHGTVVPVDVDARTGYSDGFLHCPKPFACDIQPRSEGRRVTVMREFAEAENEIFSMYDPELNHATLLSFV